MKLIIIIILIILLLLIYLNNLKKENFPDPKLISIENDGETVHETCKKKTFVEEETTDYPLKSILTKNNCEDVNNSCNKIQPYSDMVLYGINKDTEKKYTKEEREQKTQQYKNICDTRQATHGVCCDSLDDRLDSMYRFIPQSIKDNYPFVKKDVKDGKEIYHVCRGDNCLEKGFNRATTYDYCKLSKNDLDTEENINKCQFDVLNNDCQTAKCLDFDKFTLDSRIQENTFFEDYHLLTAIKDDDVKYVNSYFRDYTNDFDKQMISGYEGNTVLHEAIFYDAKACLNYLLTNKLNLTIKNKDGNTPLHIAALKGNADITNSLIKMGADKTDQNKKGDTALHCAVRSGSEGIVISLISLGCSIRSLNYRKETPLFVAIVSPNKNLKIIKYLINKGSKIIPDLLEEETGQKTDYHDEAKNIIGHTILNSLSQQKKLAVNEEVRTYIQRVAYNKFKTDKASYNKLLKQYPEYRPFEFNVPVGEETDKDLNNVIVEYDEELRRDDLYYSSYKKPIKALSPKTRDTLDNYHLRNNN